MLVEWFVRFASGRQFNSLIEQRRRDHKDDQQDKRQVQQRSDIDLAQGDQRTALGKTAHVRWFGSSSLFQILGLHFGDEFLRKIVQLDRQDAQVVHQPV